MLNYINILWNVVIIWSPYMWYVSQSESLVRKNNEEIIGLLSVILCHLIFLLHMACVSKKQGIMEVKRLWNLTETLEMCSLSPTAVHPTARCGYVPSCAIFYTHLVRFQTHRCSYWSSTLADPTITRLKNYCVNSFDSR